jgi:hypothetical protein
MSRNLRSLLPYILASLGLFITFFWERMPLFEWQISDVATDLPSTYDVSIEPSPWTAYIGDSLDDGLYISREISVESAGKSCREEDFNFVVRAPQNNKALETALNFNNLENLLWLEQWSAIEILICIIYVWLFTIWYEGPSGIGYAAVYTGIAGCIYFLGSQIARAFGSHRLLAYGYGVLDCYGTVTFNAALSKIHYEMLIVLLAFVLLELGAFGVMFHQIKNAVIERKEGSR